MPTSRTLQEPVSSPWYGCEWRVQAAQVKSQRAAVATDQLPAILTHRTLIIVVVNLHTHRHGTSGTEWMEAWTGSWGGADPLPCLRLSPSCGERFPPQNSTLFSSSPSHHKCKTPHQLWYTVWHFLLCHKTWWSGYLFLHFALTFAFIIRKFHSPSDFSSEPNACLIWIFSLASRLTGGLAEKAEEEEEEEEQGGRATGFWTEEDTIWTPVSEHTLKCVRSNKISSVYIFKKRRIKT